MPEDYFNLILDELKIRLHATDAIVVDDEYD